MGIYTGISFADSTPLRVRCNQRILIHKNFEGFAEYGKCPMRWFFAFKLHLIINNKGEIQNFMFTPGNVNDREPLRQGDFLANVKRKLCPDKEYIGQAFSKNLFLNVIQLLTRALIETGNDELMSIPQIEHSKHRSFNNFIVNALSVISAYCFSEKKPVINVNFINDSQLEIF